MIILDNTALSAPAHNDRLDIPSKLFHFDSADLDFDIIQHNEQEEIATN
ncbi:MAG TPA: hypothetical protein VER35_03395 [Candidatus Limnocylindrales bacterium]|nr:hypothetical protein [Candidatus Limnocylindrales bacterium]